MFIGLGLPLTAFGTKGGVADSPDTGSGASILLGNEAQGLAIDFTDLSMVIKDTGTPANAFSGDPNDKLSGPTLTSSATGFTVAASEDISIATSAFPFSATAGTLFAEFIGKSATGGPFHIASLSNGTFQEWISLRVLGTNPEALVFDSGNFVTVDAGTWVSSGVNKFAIAWASGDSAASYNGGTVATSATSGLPSPTSLGIGRSFNLAENYQGSIVRVMYVPRRYSNAELQALTSP
jgi:hypothetical protein